MKNENTAEEKDVHVVNGKKYKLLCHFHNYKHLQNFRYTIGQSWIGKDATFNDKYRKEYKDAVRRVICAWADNGALSKFICLGETVGVDRGTNHKAEETSIVELHYDGNIGSHMRPKAESWLNGEEVYHINCTIKHKYL